MISPIEIAPASGVGQIKTARIPVGTRKQLVFRLVDDSGSPQRLDREVENPPAPAADFSPQRAAEDANVQIFLRENNQYPDSALAGSTGLNVTGNMLDQSQYPGFVEFIIPSDQTRMAGIWDAYIVREVTGGHSVDTWPVLLHVEPTAMQMLSGTGPLLIPEVRLALLDLDNQDGGAPFSNLLDDTEFSDLDIVFAMRRTVQKWNETPPPVATYSPHNFPYRYYWLMATCGELMIMSAARYRRNRLAYSAGGVSIDDQSKAQEYEEIGRLKLREFDAWMRNEKYRINMNRCWATGI